MLEKITLYVPRVDDLWFYQRMLADPATMAYNAPWFPPDGCIPFPKEQWAAWYSRWIAQEPERFYAYLRREADGAFVGGVNLRHDAEHDWWDMGLVVYAPERGKGYGRQGMALLLDRAFRVNGWPRLQNIFEPTRAAALHLHRSFGFRETGREDGLVHLWLTRDEYFEQREREAL